MQIKQHIPNAITCLNVLCGSLAVMIAFTGQRSLSLVAGLVLLGALFDFLDGLAARTLKAYSPMGKELDSLADLISFGLAPTAILFYYMKTAVLAEAEVGIATHPVLSIMFMLSPFLIVIFSALRLAKFNVDTRQTDSFIGMPTPANALLIISFPLILQFNYTELYYDIIVNKYFIAILIVIQCYFLVSEIPMFSLKFKNLRLADNKLRFVFLIWVVALIALFQTVAIPLIIMSYILLSLFDNVFIAKPTEV